jgi:putative ABC transport system permease protein
MLRNYFTIAYRNLLKNKGFSIINIVGLAIGMSACLLILQYVSFELSYDDFRKTNVYRIADYGYMQGELIGKRAQTSPALAPALQREIPEVVHAARLVHTAPLMSDPVIQAGERSFHEERIYFADASILHMFSYQLLEGNPDKALSLPEHVLLSASMAQKYFPEQDALGQMLTFHMGERGKTQLKVSGVFGDIPENAHLHTDFLISFNSIAIPGNLDENWEWGNFYNYIELNPGSDPVVVQEKMTAVVEKHMGDVTAEWRKGGYTREPVLQAIQSIHLDSDLEAEAEPNGSRRAVEFLSIIAFFILLIAWINYLNLTTAKSAERAREISIRKVMGSRRYQLIGQFMTESLLINLLGAVLALTLVQLLAPSFRTFTGSSFASGYDSNMLWFIVTVFLIGSLLAGLYPAYLISSYQAVKGLKGLPHTSKNGIGLRKGLVVLQFAASIALITGTLAVQQQLSFMRQQDLGLDIEQTLIVKGPGIKDSTYQSRLASFKYEAAKLPSVQAIGLSSSIPGKELSWGRSFYRPSYPENAQGISIIAVDEDFFDLYQADFLAGRNFSEAYSSDKEAVIFNEKAIWLLGFDHAEAAMQQEVIWKETDGQHWPREIIGVIKDFNQEALHKEVGPVVFALKRYVNAPWAGEYYSLKISTQDYPATLAQIQASWQQSFPNSPFDYFFLDEFFNRQYQADQLLSKVFGLFSSLAILIACLGLFGLSSCTTVQRTKEIGIRKVLGASVSSIIRLLSQDFVRLVLLSAVVALPLAYWAMNEWLQNYAYRIEISGWLLVIPVLAVLLLALLTVGLHTVKAALRNPARSLRYE